ncbi:angiopoietin-1-like [Haliotis asinina]|uniref:angiopoietin-1-like n=1 Tax=Haliotis asinina TaxID=109174 RepID=UPI003531D7F6
MVFDAEETTSVLQCAITCNGVANCTGLFYCNIDNRCSFLTEDQPSVPISVPYPTCKAFSEVTTQSQCSAQWFYNEAQTNIDAAMVLDYVEKTSSLECAKTCNVVANCTGFIYCSNDNNCSILTTGKRTIPVNVPNLTCKVFTEFATSNQTPPLCQNGGTADSAACSCPPAFTGGNCETRIEGCTDVSQHVSNSAGTYTVWPTKAAEPFDLECHGVNSMIMFRDKTISGCEAVPVTYLDVPWADYKSGFTHSNCYMWLGLEKIYALTSVRPYSLYMSLKKFDATPGQVSYDAFSVGDEASEYRLSVSGFIGTGVFGDHFNLGNSATTLDGSHFCAKDHCNNSVNPCAEWHKGAWWNWLDDCQQNPHQQYDIYWILDDGTLHECKSIYMIISPA